MSITYNDNVPLSSNNPSNDQPEMLINTQALKSIWGIDHITFDPGAGFVSGQHQFVNFNGKNTPTAPSGNNSALYTVSGVANTNADMRFVNTNNGIIFPVNLIRAWGYGSAGGFTANQFINCSFSRISIGNYQITLTAGTVTTDNYGILVSSTIDSNTGNPLISYYSQSLGGVFNLFFLQLGVAFRDPTSFTFVVYQI